VGTQLTFSSTTNESTNVGLAYNPDNEGPRRGSNFSVDYNTESGQASASAGYTDPGRRSANPRPTDASSGVGFNTTFSQTGVSSNLQLNGINLATIDTNGFRLEDFNWAEQNINLAQDRTGDARRAADARDFLLTRGADPEQVRNLSNDDAQAIENRIRFDEDNHRLESRYTKEEIANMTTTERNEALIKIENQASPDTTAGATAGMTLFAGVGALLLGRRREGEVDLSDSDRTLMRDLNADVRYWEREVESAQYVTDANSQQDRGHSSYGDYAKKMLAEAKEKVANFVSDRQLSSASSTIALAKVLESKIGSLADKKIKWNDFNDLITKNPDLGKEIQGELQKLTGNVPPVKQLQLLGVIIGTIHYDQRSWSPENTRNYFIESLKNGAPLKDGDRRVTNTPGIDVGGPSYMIEQNSQIETWNNEKAKWISPTDHQN